AVAADVFEEVLADDDAGAARSAAAANAALADAVAVGGFEVAAFDDQAVEARTGAAAFKEDPAALARFAEVAVDVVDKEIGQSGVAQWNAAVGQHPDAHAAGFPHRAGIR